MAESATEVVAQLDRESVLVGRLWSHRRRGAESATFAYDPSYLTRPGAYELDPGLPLVAGQQQTPLDQALFGAFATTCVRARSAFAMRQAPRTLPTSTPAFPR